MMSQRLEQVGDDVGVTRERVRQIQVEALKKLRKALERDGYSMDTLVVVFNLKLFFNYQCCQNRRSSPRSMLYV